MSEILSLALSAIVEGLRLANTSVALRRAGRIYDLRMDILKEEERGYDSDDAKIERLYKELTIEMEAARNEFAAIMASRSGK